MELVYLILSGVVVMLVFAAILIGYLCKATITKYYIKIVLNVSAILAECAVLVLGILLGKAYIIAILMIACLIICACSNVSNLKCKIRQKKIEDYHKK